MMLQQFTQCDGAFRRPRTRGSKPADNTCIMDLDSREFSMLPTNSRTLEVGPSIVAGKVGMLRSCNQ
jgi:hypothetical protein